MARVDVAGKKCLRCRHLSSIGRSDDGCGQRQNVFAVLNFFKGYGDKTQRKIAVQGRAVHDKNCLFMAAQASIFGEVESALRNASGERRVEVLRRVTDLFVGQAEQIDPEQSELFDGVLNRLIKNIEDRAVAELSVRISPLPNAPLGTVRALAHHDSIDISGPVLTHSARLTDGDLIAIAKTKGQAHLASIAGRSRLTTMVTDVLVDHGNSDVANTLAQNAGALISNIGMAKLVMRSDGDDRLTESLALRADVPPHQFQNLLSQATEAVRTKLMRSAPPERQHALKSVLSQISNQIAPRAVPSEQYRDAQRLMNPFGQDTELLKAKVFEYAMKRMIAEVIVGLSILSGLPVEHLDRLFCVPNSVGLLAVCRSVLLDWDAVRSILRLSAAVEALADVEYLADQYNTLSPASAQRLLRFWQTRQKVAA
ncbi:MAG TPA: DUF2336 domain-containing protein [Pseudolabrys sp.]|nr:DUF2336 domain-containing protein [Pseudolabrys sp.]